MYLHILVVEDDSAKFARIVAGLRSRLARFELVIAHADHYEAALEELSRRAFDLVILDILLPSRVSEPRAEHSRAILERILQGWCLGSPIVFGITQFDETPSVDREMAFFQANLFSVLRYREDATEWESLLAARIEYFLGARTLLAPGAASNFQSDICIITARKRSEFDPIVRKMSWFGEVLKTDPLFPGASVQRGAISVGGGRRLIATIVCVGEKGLAATAAITSTALLAFRPRMIAMLGVCCGLRREGVNCLLGDIIVAREAEAWDAGRYEVEAGRGEYVHESKSVLAQLKNTDLDLLIEQCGEELATVVEGSWRRKAIQKLAPVAAGGGVAPSIRVGQVVSGLSIVDDARVRREVSRRFPAALALDMEIAGFYAACKRSVVPTSFVAIKGVADFGDGRKKGGGYDAIQPFISEITWNVLGKMLSVRGVV